MVQPVFAVGLERLGGNHRDTLEVAAESGEERTGGLLHADAQCVLVNDLDRVNLLVVRSYPRFDFRVEDTVDVPLRRLSIEVRAVAAVDAPLDLHDVLLACAEGLPALH